MSTPFSWLMLDCLDPVQLGFLYESLMKNGSDEGLNSASSKCYTEHADVVEAAIDANCGFEDYVKHHQKFCKKLADYDGRMGWKD